HLMGGLSDRLGRRRLIIAAPVIFSATCLLMTQVREVWMILALSVVNGFCLSIYWPSLQAWIADRQTGTGLARDIGSFNMSWTAATLAGPVLSGALYSLYAGLPFLVAAGIALMLFLLVFTTVQERGVSSTEKVARQDRETSHWLKRFLFAAWVANFASWFILGNARYQFPKLARELNISPHIIGLLIGFLGFALFSSFFLLRRTDLWHFKSPFLLGAQALGLAGISLIIMSNQPALFASAEAAISHGQQAQGHSGRGQSGLFDSGEARVQARPRLKETPPWNDQDTLEREKAVLGFYVSGHPLLKYREEVEGLASVRLGEPAQAKANATLRVCGIVGDVKKKIDRRGETMAFITLEDFTGKADCIVFADAFKKFGALLQPGSMVMMIGKNDGGAGGIKVIVNDVVAMDEVRKKFTKSVLLTVDVNTVSEENLFELSRIMERFRGKCVCYLQVVGGSFGNNVIYSTKKFTVDASVEFSAAVQGLLGPGSVRLQG
ncbi:MAG: MFS transporter, partial [Bacteroidetes bacterium]|nr:MFS transporter [Bacteroidota bacterium]